MKRLSPDTALAVAAGAVTVALTAAAFWLSYEHLHDLAHDNGLGHSPARAWVWPATVDLFIVVGELLMLRAALAGRTDWWAVSLTAAGSLGSIALNVASVGADRPGLEYVTAAVPPVAALLAFGVLMRQVHERLVTHPQAEQEQEAATPQQAASVTELRWREIVPAGARMLPIVARPVPVKKPRPATPKVPAREPYVPKRFAPESGAADPLVVQAAADYAGSITDGRPSVRDLKARYSIGQTRAQRIRDELTNTREKALA